MTLTFDLDLKMVPPMKFPSFIDNYTRDVILMQGLSRKHMLSKNDYIQKNKKQKTKKQTYRVTYLAKS
jgi:hypothetical protein